MTKCVIIILGDNMINNYCLGLFATDGSLQTYLWKNEDKTTHTITLEMKDQQIIEDIAKLFNTGIKYRSRIIADKKRDFYSVFIRSNLYGDLLVNKPKLFEYFKTLNNQEQNNFIRGCFDGDGGICNKKPKGYRCYFCANSKDGLDKIYEYWFEKNNIFYSKYIDKRGAMAYNYNVGKQSEVRKMCELLYEDCDIKLLRKYEKYKEMVS